LVEKPATIAPSGQTSLDFGATVDKEKKQEQASLIFAECKRRKKAGKPVNPKRVLEKYPELAEELQEYFDAEPAPKKSAATEPSDESTIYDKLRVATEPLSLPPAQHEVRRRSQDAEIDSGDRKKKIVRGAIGAIVLLVLIGAVIYLQGGAESPVPTAQVEKPAASQTPAKEPEPTP